MYIVIGMAFYICFLTVVKIALDGSLMTSHGIDGNQKVTKVLSD